MKLFYADVERALETEEDVHHEEHTLWCWSATEAEARGWLESLPTEDGDLATIREVEVPSGAALLIPLLNASMTPEGPIVDTLEARDGRWIPAAEACARSFISTGPETCKRDVTGGEEEDA